MPWPDVEPSPKILSSITSSIYARLLLLSGRAQRVREARSEWQGLPGNAVLLLVLLFLLFKLYMILIPLLLLVLPFLL